MIRPAKCHFDGFIKAFIKGADKNHNPRKGTETFLFYIMAILANSVIRTIIPARGRKHNAKSLIICCFSCDKNHNPRKGTETTLVTWGFFHHLLIRTIIPARGRKLFPIGDGVVIILRDKNHNPRKGTETLLACTGFSLR